MSSCLKRGQDLSLWVAIKINKVLYVWKHLTQRRTVIDTQEILVCLPSYPFSLPNGSGLLSTVAIKPLMAVTTQQGWLVVCERVALTLGSTNRWHSLTKSSFSLGLQWGWGIPSPVWSLPLCFNCLPEVFVQMELPVGSPHRDCRDCPASLTV